MTLRAITSGAWKGETNLFDLLIPELPDTLVRDRMIEINALSTGAEIKTVAALGKNGYVVNSVPLAIYAATQGPLIGVYQMYQQLIAAGGDTDTNASMAGQIAGALIGIDNFPGELINRLEEVPGYSWIQGIIASTAGSLST